MVVSVVKVLKSEDLSPFITSSKNTYRSDDKLIIQPKNGSIAFDFSSLKSNAVGILVSRISGNGIFSVLDERQNRQAVSRNGSLISIGRGAFTLIRDGRTRGDIALLEVHVYSDIKNADEWTVELKKADSYSCLRMVDSNLHASDGSYVNGSVKEIETDPANMYIKTDLGIKFIGSCKVVNLKIDGNSRSVIQKIKTAPLENHILKRDSDDVNFQKMMPHLVYEAEFEERFCNEDVTISNGFMLGHKGSITIPFSNMASNKYFVVVTASYINGNGKFMFGTGQSDVHIVSKQNQKFYKEIDGDVFRVYRDPDAKGSVKINNISVYSNIDNKILIQNNQNVTSDFVKIFDSSNTVKSNAIKFSREIYSEYNANVISKQSSVMFSSRDSLLWFGRVKPFIPNVSISKNPKISFCDINSLVPAKDIFLDVFSSVPDGAVDVLSKAERVFVQSNGNLLKLSDLGIRSILKSLEYPYVDGKRIPIKNGIVVSENINRSIFDLPYEFIVLNARGIYPDNVFPVNEYADYTKLSYIFSNAKACVDILEIEDCFSQIANLSFRFGCPLITNSWACMDRPDVLFINSIDEIAENIESISRFDPNKDNAGFVSFIEEVF
jgi:hypothetical protein